MNRVQPIKDKKRKNIQQPVFADGHPLNYSQIDLKLIFARSNGIASFLQSVAVCTKRLLILKYILIDLDSFRIETVIDEAKAWSLSSGVLDVRCGSAIHFVSGV